jgi:glycosyltransferase involved in cell wall biosynthesis
MAMSATGSERIVMLLENNTYPYDVRVRSEATSLARAGHEVTVIAPRGIGQRRRETIDGVRVRRYRGIEAGADRRLAFALEYGVAGLVLHLAAFRALLAGATVLHLHNPPDIFFGAGWLFRVTGRKVIFDHHDLFPETVEVKFGAGPVSRATAVCQRLTIAVANHVIATNESYAEVARHAGKRRDQVTVVRNAPPAAWTERPLALREGVLERIELGYLGAVSTQDGLDNMAPVLAALRAQAIEARLTVIGGGDALPAFRAELTRHGVEQLVSFTGWVEPARVPALLEAVDVCVDPAPATDVNNRSTMIKLAEYLALGKPVVAYDLLEARRTAQGSAVLVAPGDVDRFAGAVAELARDPEQRRALARRARERAAGLTWEHSERALFDAYAALRRRQIAL